MSARNLWMVVVASTWLVGSASAQQQVTVTTPMHSVSDRFFESTNVGWSFGVRSGQNVKVFSRFGSPARPPSFGGSDPNAGLRTGFAVKNGGFGSRFGFNFAQGSQRTFTTTAPTITLTNGVPGFLFSGRRVPFVTGVVPVLGSGGGLPTMNLGPAPTAPTPAARVLRGETALARDRRGTARLPDETSAGLLAHTQRTPPSTVITAPPSPSALRRQRQAEQAANQQQAREYFQRGREVEAKGKPNVAKHFYRLAARKADGELKQAILARLADVENR